MVQQLRPEKFGEVPRNLTPALAEFLRKLRDAVEILVGLQRSQSDTVATPRSQAVTFADLEDLNLNSPSLDSEIIASMQESSKDRTSEVELIERLLPFLQTNGASEFLSLIVDLELRLSMVGHYPDYSRRLDDIESRFLALCESRDDSRKIADLEILETFATGSPLPQNELNGAKYWAVVVNVADDGTVLLPTVTADAAGHGFIQVSAAGVIEQSAEFEIDSTGTAALIRGTAAVVVNADTDTKLCIGTAAAQNPMTIKNRLGGTKTVMLTIWYN
jgi:hypothetical protein